MTTTVGGQRVRQGSQSPARRCAEYLWCIRRVAVAAGVALSLSWSAHTLLHAQQQVGTNINVITGSADQYKGDEFRQRQNESVIGISSINPAHMLVAYNDYRTVDFVDPIPDVPPSLLQGTVTRLVAWFRAPWHRDGPPKVKGKGQGTLIAAAQAWIGLSFSDNAGRDWYTGLHPGHAALPAVGGAQPWDESPQLGAFAAASDPVLASTHDEFFVGGIAFTPGGQSAGFISRFKDRNDSETAANIHFDGTKLLVRQPARYFVDKPTVAAAPGAPNGRSFVYAAFVVFDQQDSRGLSSVIQVYRSTDSGETWAGPVVVSEPLSRNQAPWLVVDPNNPRTVYIGWRVFAARPGGITNAIVGKKSTDGGASFDPRFPYPVALFLKAFDQPQARLNLATTPPVLPIPRANAYPSVVIDGNGAIHVAMQEYVSQTTGEPLLPGSAPASGVPRITITSSYNGGVTWSPRRAVDFGPGSGSQFMPTLTAVGEPGPSCPGANGPRSRVMLLYYDARAAQVGIAPGGAGYLQGADKQFDVRLAEASACNRDSRGRLLFGPSVQMSQYARSAQKPHNIVTTVEGYGVAAVNRGYPIFCGGNCSFVGDYMGLVSRVPYVLTNAGWKLTTAAAVDRNKLPAPAIVGAWADTRDVALPTIPATQPGPSFFERLPWWNYQPPGLGKPPGQCSNPGSRDQNIYAAEYTPGWLFAAAPQTFRPSNIPRAFPLYVENRGGTLRLAKLTIETGANASFDYKTFDTAAAAPADLEADIAIGPYSTVTGSIVIGPGQSAPVRVTVAEINGTGARIAGGAQTTVTLFAAGAAAETTTETHTPDVRDQPIVTKPFPDGTFPVDVTAATPFTQNPFSQNPFSQNPFSQNPTPTPFTQNPFTQNPFTQNPFAQNAALGTIHDVTDVSFVVTMAQDGSHAAAFATLLNIRNAFALRGSYLFQVLISRSSGLPGLDGCASFDSARNIQVSSILTPFTQNPFTQNPFSQNPFSQNLFSQTPFTQNPFTQNPFTQNPFTQNTEPNEPGFITPSDPAISTSTFYLAPQGDAGGEAYRADRPPDTAVYTLRAYQIRASDDPAFVPFFSPTGEPVNVGITVIADTPNVIEAPGGGSVFDTAGPPASSSGAAVPVQLKLLTQPAVGTVNTALTPALQVAIQDSFGNTLTNSTSPVTISIGANPGDAMLGGTLTRNAVNGIATFSNLTLDAEGTGYTLIASSSGLTNATSDAFNVGVVSLFGIGDLTGGPTVSIVADATSVGGTIYAVGSASKAAAVDSPVLWDLATGLTELPQTVVPVMPPFPPGYNGFYAAEITPDASHIAGQAHNTVSDPTATTAVRVTRAGLVNTFLDQLGGNNYAINAVSISNDGSILYGWTFAPLGGPPDGIARSIRFDLSAASATIIPPLPGMTHIAVQGRAASANGSVAVGRSWTTPGITNSRAFRYVHGNPGTVTAIPLLSGGTWNVALELSPDGNLVFVEGNSTAFPNGEVYLYDAQNDVITPLGSPNSAWAPIAFGGMTANGSAVVVSFLDAGVSRGHLRNSHGWFPLGSAVTGGGVDAAALGWDVTAFNVADMSVVEGKELVFGSAPHNGSVEGFIAQFPAGYLAAFNPQLTGTFQGLVPAQGLLFTPPGACNGYNATFAFSQFGNQIIGTADLTPTGGVCTDLRSIEQNPFQVLTTRVFGAVNGTAVSLGVLAPRFNLGVPNQITAVLASGTTDGLHLTLGGSVITRRTWNDLNGNLVADCNLANPAANGECGADSLTPENFTLTATRVP